VPLTVGELIRLLEGQPFDLPVYLSTGHGPRPLNRLAPGETAAMDEQPHSGQAIVLES
jgi:hypothetical protein